jgi:hypothetical protein
MHTKPSPSPFAHAALLSTYLQRTINIPLKNSSTVNNRQIPNDPCKICAYLFSYIWPEERRGNSFKNEIFHDLSRSKYF